MEAGRAEDAGIVLVSRVERFALLLDSGATRPLPGVRNRDEARERLVRHNAEYRACIAKREQCRRAGNIADFPLVCPRIAVGLIVPKASSRAARQIGSIGGKARAAKLSPARRSEIARKAARARWAAA